MNPYFWDTLYKCHKAGRNMQATNGDQSVGSKQPSQVVPPVTQNNKCTIDEYT